MSLVESYWCHWFRCQRPCDRLLPPEISVHNSPDSLPDFPKPRMLALWLYHLDIELQYITNALRSCKPTSGLVHAQTANYILLFESSHFVFGRTDGRIWRLMSQKHTPQKLSIACGPRFSHLFSVSHFILTSPEVIWAVRMGCCPAVNFILDHY